MSFSTSEGPMAKPLKVGSHFSVRRKIGVGDAGFHSYQGVDLRDYHNVIIKFEQREPYFLKDEAEIYQVMDGCFGVPRLHYHGQEGSYYVTVTDLLGPTLDDIFHRSGGQFSVKSTCMAAKQMGLYLPQYQLVKFLIGLPETEHSGTIFIIDFMHATPWCDLQTKRHIPYRTEISNALAARYASINTHLGYEQSRRDDLESLGYMLLYLARGWLPWQGVMGADIPEQHLKVLRIKQEVSIADLCEGLPDEFSIYLQCVRNLAFTETPDYDFLRSLFTNALRRMGYVEDGVYDWMRPQYGTRQKASDVRVFYVDNDIEYLESPTLNSNRKGRHPQPSTLQDNPLATRSMQALGPESLRPAYSRVTQKTKTDPLSAQSKELDSSVTTPPDRVELSLFIPWSKEFSGKYRQRTTSAYAYGGFSNVWICDAEKHDSTLHAVAMKELRPVNMPRTVADSEAILKQMLKRAEREFTIWAQLEHPNVAPLIGFRLQPVMRLFSPWYSNGNIKQWVISHPEMEQVARGLVYLHSLTPPIAHGDIKSDNVLINDDGDPVIIDFGLSQAIDDIFSQFNQATSTSAVGNARWLAPELYCEEGCRRSTASDVYAFGSLILEVSTGAVPYRDLSDFNVILALANGKPPVREKAKYPELDEKDPLWDIMFDCWTYERQQRPSMQEVEVRLRNL